MHTTWTKFQLNYCFGPTTHEPWWMPKIGNHNVHNLSQLIATLLVPPPLSLNECQIGQPQCAQFNVGTCSFNLQSFNFKWRSTKLHNSLVTTINKNRAMGLRLRFRILKLTKITSFNNQIWTSNFTLQCAQPYFTKIKSTCPRIWNLNSFNQ
jgi:hypothetical protein